jgi:hypothetical protein
VALIRVVDRSGRPVGTGTPLSTSVSQLLSTPSHTSGVEVAGTHWKPETPPEQYDAPVRVQPPVPHWVEIE